VTVLQGEGIYIMKSKLRRYLWLPVPAYGEVLEEVKVDVLRLAGEKLVEFQEEQFRAWFGEPWQRQKDASGIIVCPGCANSSGDNVLKSYWGMPQATEETMKVALHCAYVTRR